mmetsp:Transcript_46899/g.99632  ORF Transcript_46899/g.99632 Transcript_46899/m.99632 type:complete len:265 (-) Transcript_46899:81-875(-)
MSHLSDVAAPVGRSPPPLASRSREMGALSLPRGTWNFLTCAPRSILMPLRVKSATSNAAMSLSSPIFINAFRGMLSLMIRVTSLPKFLNILANSIAMMPLPVMATLLGSRSSVLIESLSKTLFPSNGMPPGRKGVDPVATSILSAFNVAMDMSLDVMKRLEDPPESAKAASPWTYVTPAYSSWRTVSRALKEARSTQDVTISFQMLSSLSPMPFRLPTEILLPASLNALLYSPVGPPMLRSSPVFSFINAPLARGASMSMTLLL